MFSIKPLVPRLRRLIGDTEEYKQYSDEILLEYLADAIYNVLLIYQHNYEAEVIEEEIEEETEIDVVLNEEPSALELTIFLIQAKLDMLTKNRDISFRSGALSVTHKENDKDYLVSRLEKAIKFQKTNNLKLGSSSTEYDTFSNRLEAWLEKLRL